MRSRKLFGPIRTVLFFVLVVAFQPAAGVAQSFDHSVLDRLLKDNVDALGMVDYDAFARSPEFRRYLDQLAGADLRPLPRGEQLALWINAYNAYTIELINRHGERRSIRNINRTLGLIRGKGPWAESLAEVAGTSYTLDHIEHEIIRPRFQEPRIHFALVCAAVGCPPLRREAFYRVPAGSPARGAGARVPAGQPDQERGSTWPRVASI